MAYDNRVDEIAPFKDDVLAEVVREGEALLAAQLSVATAADQRAMTFAGFLLAAATAAAGGVVALILSDKPTWNVALIGAGYCIAAILAASLAVWSARPAEFSFPGNEPSSWHPEQWHVGANGPHSLHQARVEQAVTLQRQISRNKGILKRNARYMRAAVITGFLATIVAAIATIIWASSAKGTANAHKEANEQHLPVNVNVACGAYADGGRYPGQKTALTAENVSASPPGDRRSIKRAGRSARSRAVQECRPSHRESVP